MQVSSCSDISSGLNRKFDPNVRTKSGIGPFFFQNLFGLLYGFLTNNRGVLMYQTVVMILTG